MLRVSLDPAANMAVDGCMRHVLSEDIYGRLVTVRGFDKAGRETFKVFDVGLGPEDMAITAVRIVRPEFAACKMQASERLSATAVAFIELQPGEVRERHGV